MCSLYDFVMVLWSLFCRELFGIWLIFLWVVCVICFCASVVFLLIVSRSSSIWRIFWIGWEGDIIGVWGLVVICEGFIGDMGILLIEVRVLRRIFMSVCWSSFDVCSGVIFSCIFDSDWWVFFWFWFFVVSVDLGIVVDICDGSMKVGIV